MIQTSKKILHLLSHKERKKLNLLFIAILVMAFLDMIGVASIMPFMMVLVNPDSVDTNYLLNGMFNYLSIFGVKTIEQFVFFLGIFVFVFLLLSLSFKAFVTYLQLRFTLMCQYSLGQRLVERYLHQPYSWFLNRNSADLGKNILSEVTTVIGGSLVPMITLLAQSAVAIALLILIFLNNPKIALLVCLALGGSYGLIYLSLRGFIRRIGKERYKANVLRFTALSEAFGAIKEIKVSGLEQTYISRFNDPSKIFALRHSSAQILSQLPRYGIEATAFGGLILVSLYFLGKSGTFVETLPIVTLYAFAGYRLMPALQAIYSALTQLRYASPALEQIYNDFKLEKINNDFDDHKTLLNNDNNDYDKDFLAFNESICLKNINYFYPNSSKSTLKNINFEIKFKSTVGLVGATGSGKTTIVDIILGLLECQNGTLEVDGHNIDKFNCRAWRRSIGYVPQQIYLADDTVAANIAFGIDQKEIDQEAVEKAAKIANLHHFIKNELSNQYLTKVGERGIRLSGGQRQRIGIARALYHNPKVLIFDEATSSLDNLTEQAVMEAVRKLQKKITIILIAHRLTTVKECDTIFVLDKGELIGQGKYQELIKSSEIFKKMTRIEDH